MRRRPMKIGSRKGGYLVAVHVEDSKKGDAVRDILKKNGLEDISSVSEK